MPYKNLSNIPLDRNQVMANAQAMYELRGWSMRQIAAKFGVSQGIIQIWKDKGKWLNKKEVAPLIVEITRQKMLNVLAEKGMPPEKAMDLLIEGMTQPMTDQIVCPPSKDKSEDGEPQPAEVVFEGLPDYKVRHKFHHDYLVLAGLIGNNNAVQVNNAPGGTVNLQVNIPMKKEVD